MYSSYPANIYQFKITLETQEKGMTYLKLTIKARKIRHWRRCGILIINLEHIL